MLSNVTVKVSTVIVFTIFTLIDRFPFQSIYGSFFTRNTAHSCRIVTVQIPCPAFEILLGQQRFRYELEWDASEYVDCKIRINYC